MSYDKTLWHVRLIDACIMVTVICGLFAAWMLVTNAVMPPTEDRGLELEKVSILFVTNQRDVDPITAYAVVSPEDAEILRETAGSWRVLIDRGGLWR